MKMRKYEKTMLSEDEVSKSVMSLYIYVRNGL